MTTSLLNATKGYRGSVEQLSTLVESGAAIDVRDRSVQGADKPIGEALNALVETDGSIRRSKAHTSLH